MHVLALLAGAAIGAPPPGGLRLEGLVVGADARAASGVRVILGEIGRASLYYNRPEAMFVTTPGLPDAERARWAAELRSGEDGRFEVAGLAPGEYALVAADGARGIAIAAARLGGEATRVELTLVPAAFLEAELSGLPFDPQADVLQLEALGTGSNVQIVPTLDQTPRSWSFRGAPLPAGLQWRLRGTSLVRPQGFPATRFSIPLALAAGERGRIALDLGAGLEIGGTVLDDVGRPLANVSVVARKSGANPEERGAITDAEGRYRIQGLSAGTHVLEATRWSLRELAGCGTGPRDVAALREVVLPFADEAAGPIDFRIEGLAAAPQVGQPAPPFRVPALGGGTLDLAALRGKVVLIEFWATWCGMCRLEMPRLIEAYARHARGGRFEIVGVSIDRDVELVPRFVASRGLPWPQTALGPAGENPLARLYNVNSTPATVLVDAAGRIAALNLSGAALVERIEGLLEP